MHLVLRRILAALLSFSCAGLCAYGYAAPYLPSSDAQVLERLPMKPNDPLARALANLRAQWQREPTNPEFALALAQHYFDLVSEEGDPRYLGYAQAALKPWWDLANPPESIQVLRASLRQFRHDFAGAISDLDAVIARSPQNGQAHALRATIHIVQARYALARRDCSQLRVINPKANEMIATACEAMADGANGKNAQALASLQAVFKAQNAASKADQLWILLRLAELAERQTQLALAEGYYKQALALGITNTFLYAAYADFLFDQQRYAEVLALLKEKTRSDVLLLRIVLAEHRLQTPNRAQNRNTLANRYAAAQMRGDTVHQQEEARFALHIENQAKKSLQLAQENWKVQREPRDARIFLEAALALRDPQGAQPVLQWMQESKHEDVLLRNLAKQLTSASPVQQGGK